MTFKKGDIIRCNSSEWSFIDDGSDYTVTRDQTGSDVYIQDNDGDESEYPASDFTLIRYTAAARKLKLPLLFQTKAGLRYVLTRDGSRADSLSVTNATTGEVFTNHVDEEKAMEYFVEGTWIANNQVKLLQDVAEAKAALAKAEKALAASTSYLA